jgi:hypothetical protein
MNSTIKIHFPLCSFNTRITATLGINAQDNAANPPDNTETGIKIRKER